MPTITTSPNLSIVPASEPDIPALTALTLQTFSIYALEREIGNEPTPAGLAAATPRFLRAHRDHLAETNLPPFIRCIHTDPVTGAETTAACAQWYIFPTPRSELDVVSNPGCLMALDWLPEGETRDKAVAAFRPMLEVRTKWSRGRGIAVLLYMATREEWRRKGAATMCVRWGMERCRELGIPAYLDASPTGRLVYEKLGFEVVDEFNDGLGTVTPVMMWWPPGMKEEEKRVIPRPGEREGINR